MQELTFSNREERQHAGLALSGDACERLPGSRPPSAAPASATHDPVAKLAHRPVANLDQHSELLAGAQANSALKCGREVDKPKLESTYVCSIRKVASFKCDTCRGSPDITTGGLKSSAGVKTLAVSETGVTSRGQ